MRESWKGWCDQVCRQVRFGPDRDAIREELDRHMEDHCGALQAEGVDEREAERLTKEAMGDPVEVGSQLDRVHKPLLGWLWMASKVVVILLTVAALCLGLPHLKENITIVPGDRFQETEFYEVDGIPQNFYGEYDLSARAGGYTFQVNKAGMWQRTDDVQELWIGLNVRYPWPWEELSTDAFYGFYLVDDQGNRYDYYYRYIHDNEYFVIYGRSGLLTGSYVVYVPRVPPDIQWMELRYDRGGQQMTFHIGLTEGGAK